MRTFSLFFQQFAVMKKEHSEENIAFFKWAVEQRTKNSSPTDRQLEDYAHHMFEVIGYNVESANIQPTYIYVPNSKFGN